MCHGNVLPPPTPQSASTAAELKSRNNYLRPFAGLTKRFESTMSALGMKASGGGQGPDGLPALPASPLSGQLYMEGCLGGSITAPSASLDVRVDQGAIGNTRLSQVCDLLGLQHTVVQYA